MKLTFPHMGNLSICLKSMFESMGLEVVLPPPITKRTMDLGAKHSPEFACLPLKINMGNYMEAIERGADTIVMLGGVGPCRFGYYAQVQRRILRDLGYDFDMIVVEPPENKMSELTSELGKLRNNNSWKTILTTVYLAFNKLKAFDQIDKKVSEVRPRTKQAKILDNLYNEFKRHALNITSNKQLKYTTREVINELDKLKTEDIEPVKIIMVGEIYMVLDYNANLNIQKKLGDMGAHIERNIYISDWILDHVLLDKVGLERNKNVFKSAKPFLNHFVGGHGIDSVGEAVVKSNEGYEGVIHVMPFTCTPEIIAQNILPEVSKQHDMPLLTIILDEHTGEAGLVTRLEAFYDLLKRKKEIGFGVENDELSRAT